MDLVLGGCCGRVVRAGCRRSGRIVGWVTGSSCVDDEGRRVRVVARMFSFLPKILSSFQHATSVSRGRQALCKIISSSMLKPSNVYADSHEPFYNFSFTFTGNILSSNFRMYLFVCSARLKVNIVCGRILAKCAKKPLYMAKSPSVFTVLIKQSNTPLYRLPV